MGSSLQRKLKIIMGLALAASIVVAFQNCTPAFEFVNQKSEANGNGTGYDGKAYANFGSCPGESGPTQKSVILLEENGSGLLVRENCLTVNPPQALKAKYFEMSKDGTSALVYEAKVFDHVDPVGPVNITRAMCWVSSGTGNTEVRILQTLATDHSLSALSGYVVNSNNGSTGLLTPVLETLKPSMEVIYGGSDFSGSNQFTLRLYLSAASYGQLTYKIPGEATQTRSTQDCFVNDQLLDLLYQVR